MQQITYTHLLNRKCEHIIFQETLFYVVVYCDFIDTRMFIVILLQQPQTKNYSIAPNIRMEKQIVVYSHTTACHRAMKTKDLLLLARVWMALVSIILNEKSQIHQRIYTAWLHLYKVQKLAKLICAVLSQDKCYPCEQKASGVLTMFCFLVWVPVFSGVFIL